MFLTPENAKDYVGMKLYADRSILGCYPYTVFQYPDGTYATEDRAGVCSPVDKDLFNQVWFDRAEPCKEENECVFSDYTDMPYQFDNMTGSMNL